MAVTNLSELQIDDHDGSSAGLYLGSTLVTATAAELNAMNVISETVAYTDFTNGTATGTYTMSGTIPAGAVYYWSAVTSVGGFAGDSSASMTIGDGTDADRYCGTAGIDVFSTVANGVDAGTPSGVRYHAAAKSPVLTITPGSDFGSVTAGTVSIKLFYFS